jgi:ankyrin repeat protein
MPLSSENTGRLKDCYLNALEQGNSTDLVTFLNTLLITAEPPDLLAAITDLYKISGVSTSISPELIKTIKKELIQYSLKISKDLQAKKDLADETLNNFLLLNTLLNGKRVDVFARLLQDFIVQETPEKLRAILNYTDNQYNPILFTFCQEFTDVNIARILFESGADINLPSQQLSSQTVIHQKLKSHTTTQSPSHFYPIHGACNKKNVPMVKFLLENNADVHARTNEKMTPLHFACDNSDSDMVDLLLNYGAAEDILEESTVSMTPLLLSLREAALNSHNIKLTDIIAVKLLDNVVIKNDQQKQNLLDQIYFVIHQISSDKDSRDPDPRGKNLRKKFLLGLTATLLSYTRDIKGRDLLTEEVSELDSSKSPTVAQKQKNKKGKKNHQSKKDNHKNNNANNSQETHLKNELGNAEVQPVKNDQTSEENSENSKQDTQEIGSVEPTDQQPDQDIQETTNLDNKPDDKTAVVDVLEQNTTPIDFIGQNSQDFTEETPSMVSGNTSFESDNTEVLCLSPTKDLLLDSLSDTRTSITSSPSVISTCSFEEPKQDPKQDIPISNAYDEPATIISLQEALRILESNATSIMENPVKEEEMEFFGIVLNDAQEFTGNESRSTSSGHTSESSSDTGTPHLSPTPDKVLDSFSKSDSFAEIAISACDNIKNYFHPTCLYNPLWTTVFNRLSGAIQKSDERGNPKHSILLYGSANHKFNPGDLDMIMLGLTPEEWQEWHNIIQDYTIKIKENNLPVANEILKKIPFIAELMANDATITAAYTKKGKYNGIIIKTSFNIVGEHGEIKKSSVDFNILPPEMTMESHANSLDYSINAIYHDPRTRETFTPIPDTLIHLQQGLLHPVRNPVEMFRDDPSIIFRAARMIGSARSANQNLTLSHTAQDAIKLLFAENPFILNMMVDERTPFQASDKCYHEMSALFSPGSALNTLSVLNNLDNNVHLLSNFFPYLKNLNPQQYQEIFLLMRTVAHLIDTSNKTIFPSLMYYAAHWPAIISWVNQTGAYPTSQIIFSWSKAKIGINLQREETNYGCSFEDIHQSNLSILCHLKNGLDQACIQAQIQAQQAAFLQQQQFYQQQTSPSQRTWGKRTANHSYANSPSSFHGSPNKNRNNRGNYPRSPNNIAQTFTPEPPGRGLNY